MTKSKIYNPPKNNANYVPFISILTSCLIKKIGFITNIIHGLTNLGMKLWMIIVSITNWFSPLKLTPKTQPSPHLTLEIGYFLEKKKIKKNWNQLIFKIQELQKNKISKFKIFQNPKLMFFEKSKNHPTLVFWWKLMVL